MVFKKGTKPWTYGLSADPNNPNFDPRIAKYGKKISITLLEKYAKGELRVWSTGLTKDTDPRLKAISIKVAKANKGKSRNKKGWISLICLHCSKEFKVTPSIAKIRKHCGKKCHIETQKKTRKGKGNPAFGRKRPDLAEYNRTHIRRGKNHPNYGNHKLKGRPFTQEHKEKIRLAQLENGKCPIFRARMRKQRMEQVLPSRNTSIEIKLQKELKRRNIDFVCHYVFNGRFELDIAFPSKQVAVEADGNYYHNFPHGLPRDKSKNAYLRKCGWLVLRFWGSEINSDVKSCVDKIMTALNGLKLEKL